MELRTFQRLSRVADLERDGVLTGDWSRVPEYVREPYRAMVAEMERAGIHTAGRPPVWAWRGPLQLLDASMLFDPEYELSTGYATIRFDAPPELAVERLPRRRRTVVAGSGARWTGAGVRAVPESGGGAAGGPAAGERVGRDGPVEAGLNHLVRSCH